MNEDFTLYNEALALKELGFDEPCLGRFYTKPHSKMFGIDEKGRHYPIKNISKKLYVIGEHFVLNDSNVILAPTYSQAFRWFREKHQIHSWIEFDFHMFDVIILNGNDGERIGLISSMGDSSPYHFYTYEEAELRCLRKLIELVKSKQ